MGRGNRRFFKRFTKFFRRTRQAAAFDKRSRKTAKLSIYKTWKTWYFDIGSFPISHPLGPHGVCPCGSFLCHEENRPAPGGFSLSKKCWPNGNGKEKSCERRAAPHKDNNKITVQSITKSGSQKGCTPQGNKVNRG